MEFEFSFGHSGTFPLQPTLDNIDALEGLTDRAKHKIKLYISERVTKDKATEAFNFGTFVGKLITSEDVTLSAAAALYKIVFDPKLEQQPELEEQDDNLS